MSRQLDVVLSTRDIKRICRQHGWHCQLSRIIDPSLPLFKDRRYRRFNSIQVARGASQWLTLGWKWDIEAMTEEEIVSRLATLGENNGNYTSYNGEYDSDQATDHPIQ